LSYYNVSAFFLSGISGDAPPLNNALTYPVISSSPSGPAILYAQASQIVVIPLDETDPVQEKSNVLLALKVDPHKS